MKRYLWILAAPVLAGAQIASVELSAPTLGYVFDQQSKSLVTVDGVPGAALLGGAVQIGVPIDWIAVAPNRRYGLGAREGQMVLVRLDGGTGMAAPVDLPAGSVFFSPSGSAAAIYTGSRLEVYGGMPDNPNHLHSFAADLAGEGKEFAVSDDGNAAIGVAGGELWRLSEDTGETLGTGFRGAAFLRRSQDLLALDGNGNRLVLFRKAQSGEPEEEEAEGIAKPLAFALSADERIAAILLEDNALLLLNRDTHAAVRLDLGGIDAQGVWRAEGNAVFQLARDASADIWIADGDAAAPRLAAVLKGGNQ
ncbi:MAG: hypothetical protein LC126_00830 [Bryobacterales bacterium]|nr:hypothetical protein [Bryobacterales bacterium]